MTIKTRDEHIEARAQNPDFVGAVDRNAFLQYRFYLGKKEGHNMFRVELWRRKADEPYTYHSLAISLRAGKLADVEKVMIRVIETYKRNLAGAVG